jgi:hypothetical protein
MIRLALASLVVAMLVATPAAARDWSEVVRPIRAGEPIQLRTDKAYLLVRIGLRGTTQDPVFLREPEPAEIAAFDSARGAAFAKKGGKGDLQSFIFDYQGMPNLFVLSHRKALAADKEQATVLAEVMPGRYVLYGQAFGGFIFQCNCLGTVGFDAPAGVVTDLGSYLSDRADKLSVYPELASETNIGPTARMDFLLFVSGLVPARANGAVPGGVDHAMVRPAVLHAVGPYVDPNVMHINRLAPIPGVLRYDGGQVIDVASGQEAKPH